MRWWEPVGRRSLSQQTRKCRFFNQIVARKITFLDVSLQLLIKPDHSLHGITLLSKLYQHIYTVSSQHCLFPLTWKSSKMTLKFSNFRKRSETRLNSCVCDVHECRYSTDNNSAQRACFLKSIERVKEP